MNGRPLRFLAIVLVGWIAARVFLLWPVAGPAAIPRVLVPAAFADDAPVAVVLSPQEATTPPRHAPAPMFAGRRSAATPGIKSPPMLAVEPPSPRLLDQARLAPPPSQTPSPILAPPSPLAPPAPPRTDRWSASAWLVLRDGRGIAPGLSGGQLGGGQAGVRIAYAATDRLAIVGRIASPIRGVGREAALGIEWRPTRLPVRLVAEYRQPIDTGRGGPAVGVIAGTGPAPLAIGFDLETYGQVGVIRRHRTEPFAEGSARLSRPVVAAGRLKLDLGLGAWGGAQRGAQRLDVGPSLGIRLPVARTAIRASLDCGIM